MCCTQPCCSSRSARFQAVTHEVALHTHRGIVIATCHAAKHRYAACCTAMPSIPVTTIRYATHILHQILRIPRGLHYKSFPGTSIKANSCTPNSNRRQKVCYMDRRVPLYIPFPCWVRSDMPSARCKFIIPVVMELTDNIGTGRRGRQHVFHAEYFPPTVGNVV